jgi:phage/plasmid-associated DNA primase
VPVNPKGKDVITARFFSKFFVASNSIPHISDLSNGFWRRMTFVEVKNKVSEKDTINNIENLIVRDNESMLSLIDFFAEGILRIQARKKLIDDEDMPESIRQAKEKLRHRNNSIAQWVEARGLRHVRFTTGWTPVVKLHDSYKEFCAIDLGGKKPMLDEKFWPELHRIFDLPGQALERKAKNIDGRVVKAANISFVPLKESPNDFMTEDLNIPLSTDHPDIIFGIKPNAAVH